MTIPDIENLTPIQHSVKYISKHYPEFYEMLMREYPEELKFSERLYWFKHRLTEYPKCIICGKPTAFKNGTLGYTKFCSCKCSANDPEKKEKMKKTNLERYGSVCSLHGRGIRERVLETFNERYGTDNPAKSQIVKEKAKQHNLKKYGVEWVMQDKNIRRKRDDTMIERYGTKHALQNEEILEKTKQHNLKKYGVEWVTQTDEVKRKASQTFREKYGVEWGLQDPGTREKISKTCVEKYGVEWACQRKEARAFTNDSKPNRLFAQLLDSKGIHYTREFPLHNYSFDFKIGNILVEIDPYATHNSTWGLFNDPKPRDYHYRKTQLAKENGYRCIHVWDWDDPQKIVSLLKTKEVIYARNCEIREVGLKECNLFLNTYHLQSTCRGQKIRIGLYYNNELVSVMTFGTPRYNKNYEYELLRLCSSYKIVGGAERMFKYFVKTYHPQTIISYCDNSKFTGDVYNRLGFVLKHKGESTKHWFNGKMHITDNLLRQRGYDQIFGTDYGIGTSNEQLMREHKFVEIYDVGQSTWCWQKEKA